ncbi:MAG: hypothetical protein CMJ32_00075 [Phycisphaerae bacterium]|nr:hypothetical protein [Phycisphaerae bacterium]
MLDFNSRNTKADRFVALIDAAIDRFAANEKPRKYLGGSAVGETCLRRLQFDYQGAPQDEGAGFTARTRRIFHRGHQGEEWVADWIRGAGFNLKTEKAKGGQFGFEDCDGRFKGHIDGVIIEGPEGFDYPALWENKVLGSKGYGQLVKHGVAKAYPKYAAQVATYQAYLQLAEHPAFFTALNADTMEIHLELVKFDQALAQASIDKAARVLDATDHGETLPRATADPASFVCRFCPYQGACWQP